jgi:hypothetical protein
MPRIDALLKRAISDAIAVKPFTAPRTSFGLQATIVNAATVRDGLR